MVKNLFAAMSPAGPAARLSTLIFHRVLPSADPLFPDEVDADRFDRICGWVKTWFNVLPLDEAARRLKQCTLPSRAMAITFDDGYEDNHSVAMPILQRHGLTATFFVATGFLDGGRMWNDTVIEAVRRTPKHALDLGPELGRFDLGSAALRRNAIDHILPGIKYLPVAERQAMSAQIAIDAGVEPPSNLMMSSAQVSGLKHAGMQIGAHTVSHPILAKLDREQARTEIAGSKARLEQLLGEPIELFAYPNGKPGADYIDDSVALVRDLGFTAAVSTAWGTAQADSDLLQLPRFTPWDRSGLRFGARLLANLRH